MSFGKINILLLIAICAASLSLVVPTIANNVSEPNLILYFSSDEGDLMDLVWSYYAKEKRDSYQLSLDYGLELVYLSDLARAVPGKFMRFTPGTFVLILRWLHAVAWAGALIALWFFIGRHFGRGWPQILATLLLWSRPAFDYFIKGLKPDPLVLLFMIIGLNYILRMIDKPSMKYLFISMACASIAFIVKFAGVFLLPAAIAAMYLGSRRVKGPHGRYAGAYPEIRSSWIFPALLSAPLIGAPICAIFFYARKATGLTYFRELGFWPSVLKFKIIFLFWSAGAALILLSVIILFLNRNKNPIATKIAKIINEINSHAIIVTTLFAGFVLLFGFRWITIPWHFLETYAMNGIDFISGDTMGNITSVSEYLNMLVTSLRHKLISYDILMMLLFMIYLICEMYTRNQHLDIDRTRYCKRLTLNVYLIPFFLSIFSIGRLEQLHMLPFFVAICALTIEGVGLLGNILKDRVMLRKAAVLFMMVVFAVDILINGVSMAKTRLYAFRQNEDIAFDAKEWFEKNIPKDASILADHYIRIYIPDGYKNIKVLDWNTSNDAGRFQKMVQRLRPRYIYYNNHCLEPAPPVEAMLPGVKTELIKVFDGAKKKYYRVKTDKFFLYRILY